MEDIKLNLVHNIGDITKKGDAITVIGRGERLQLIICCPNCGETSGSAGNHVYNRETKTYHPSIIHDKDLGGCGWHGWLRNGVFSTC